MRGANDDLPDGWINAPFSAVAVDPIQRVPSEKERITYIDIGSVDRETKTIVQPQSMLGKDAPSRARKVIQTGDVLVSTVRPNLNAVALVEGRYDGQFASTGFDVLRSPIMDPRWLFYSVRTPEFLDRMSELVQGALYPAVRSKDIRSFVIPIAPLAEQKRIADKLEAVLGRVDACRARLERVPALLKRFRQSVLAAAMSGGLTEDWREENQDAEPADALLARIRASRLTLAKTVREKHLIEDGVDEHHTFLSAGRSSGDQLPDSWLACNIGAVSTVCNGSTPSRSKLEFWDGDIPWVSSGEVRNNVIGSTREQITKLGYEKTSVRLLPRGTVLLAMIGEGKTRGQSALLSIAATINQNIAAVVLDHGLVDSKFVWRWFQFQYEATRLRGNGTGPQALNCQRVRELPFILAPLAEQQEIVRRVEALFAFADRIEARLATAQKTVDRLTPATLAKAFRGELAPQDPTDEPASALLERLRSQPKTKPAKGKRAKDT